MTTPAEKLRQLGIELGEIAKPVANYVPWKRSGHFLYVSGQLPFLAGKLLHTGLVGESVTVDEARICARQCAINIIAIANAATEGRLEQVAQITKLTGFVACNGTFQDHPSVVNGASDLMVEVFGERGRHARSAIGVASLPLKAPVEIEAILDIL